MLKSISVTTETAALLNLKNNETVYFSQVLHFENDQPIQLEQGYVNAALIPEYLQQNFSDITPHEYLSTIVPLTNTTNEIEAVLASDDICQLLNIDKSQPCLQIKRCTWSSKGAVSVVTLTACGDKFRLGNPLVC